MKRKDFSQKEINKIINLYQNEHLSLTKIGEEFQVSRSVITRIIKENNIPIKTSNHIYYADYRKFQKIDTPEKAYWLGYIAADGCVFVRENNATIRISCAEKDAEHLKKFKEFMNSNVKIRTSVNTQGFSQDAPTTMYSIAFNSVDMAQDLINKNVVPNKSLILQPPNISEEFYLPYILGYFDGDGTIYKFNNNTEYNIGFIGSYDIINWINKIINLNATLEQRRKDSQTYYIRCGGLQKPYNIIKPLYDSVNVHLDRKFLLFKELESVVLNRNIK